MADNSSTKRATKQVHPDVLTELGFLFDDSVNITNYDNRNTIDGRITSKYCFLHVLGRGRRERC